MAKPTVESHWGGDDPNGPPPPFWLLQKRQNEQRYLLGQLGVRVPQIHQGTESKQAGCTELLQRVRGPLTDSHG
eukprot:136100-Pyramimonas_sp.AAC.1